LSARHDAEKTKNVSQFLLEELGLAGRLVAMDVNGRKRPLSFRDLVRYCLVDETAIQSETSPVESGQVITPTVERSVFKLLLTGQDDSAVVTIQDRKSFKAATTAKLEVVDELIKLIDEELTADFPAASDLQEQSDRLDETLRRAQQEMPACSGIHSWHARGQARTRAEYLSARAASFRDTAELRTI
jgi:hypothetical protein